jgi:molybdopterin-guanine dinucleotide biosynthesis protein A
MGPLCQLRGYRHRMQQPGGIVVAGGGGTRLGGLDKAALEVRGRSLLDRALDALSGAAPVIVVGDPLPVARPVTFTREEPAGGGPAAAVLAGLRTFGTLPAVVVVLAVDMPFVTAGTVARLLAALGRGSGEELDGVTLVDRDGRHQPLCAAYRVEALLTAAPAYDEEAGLPMHRLVGGLRLARIPAVGDEARDVDTPSDLGAITGE